MTQQARFVPAYNTTTNVAEFKPAWVEPAPAGIVLSAASAINITATSATPRVTVTLPA